MTYLYNIFNFWWDHMMERTFPKNEKWPCIFHFVKVNLVMDVKFYAILELMMRIPTLSQKVRIRDRIVGCSQVGAQRAHNLHITTTFVLLLLLVVRLSEILMGITTSGGKMNNGIVHRLLHCVGWGILVMIVSESGVITVSNYLLLAAV